MPAAERDALVRHLRLMGHQVTAPRAAVIDAVAAQERPFTAADLCAAVAARAPGVGRATVFRMLELLERARVVERVHTLSGGASYVVRDPARWAADAPHQYLVCVACEGVTEVADTRLGAALQTVAHEHAFRPAGTLVEVFGRCETC
jgi:Fur family ferric uptake transcriptional regulator